MLGNSTGLDIVLVRAGSTDLDEQGRITGSLDMPLSTAGEAEARETSVELDDVKFKAIFSASCLAAQQTAQQLSRDGRIRVRVEESWTNLDHGLWHGKSLSELKETQPRLYRQWVDSPESICPPGGETIEEVRQRLAYSLKKIRRKFKNGCVAIVAPEPLFSIIRAEIEDSEVRELLQYRSDFGRWETINIPSDVSV